MKPSTLPQSGFSAEEIRLIWFFWLIIAASWIFWHSYTIPQAFLSKGYWLFILAVDPASFGSQMAYDVTRYLVWMIVTVSSVLVSYVFWNGVFSSFQSEFIIDLRHPFRWVGNTLKSPAFRNEFPNILKNLATRGGTAKEVLAAYEKECERSSSAWASKNLKERASSIISFTFVPISLLHLLFSLAFLLQPGGVSEHITYSRLSDRCAASVQVASFPAISKDFSFDYKSAELVRSIPCWFGLPVPIAISAAAEYSKEYINDESFLRKARATAFAGLETFEYEGNEYTLSK